MRLLKVVGFTLAVALAANALGWVFVGRGSAIGLTVRPLYEHIGSHDDLDTVYVYDGYRGASNDEWDTPGDFASGDREDLLAQLQASSGADVVVYSDSEGDPFSETVNFGVWVRRDYPLVAHVASSVTTLGFAADYRRWYVWAFGWRPVGPALSGIS